MMITRRSISSILFLITLLHGVVVPSVSWTIPPCYTAPSRRAPLTLHSSSSSSSSNNSNNNNNNNNEEETEEDFQRRMAVVRSLQNSFYASAADKAPSQLEASTGLLKDLPLWRVQWWEIPGRSNVLNVHEPIYTNMFETILYGPKPWCFGHLFLEGGSPNLKSKKASYQLHTWETSSSLSSSPTQQHSAVVGCLMNISDYRRLSDGRLLLLVHAMERFVVTDIQQTLPYSIVNAQIIPDAEEIDPDLEFGSPLIREVDLAAPRAAAVQESVRFHDYEYDREHVLPIPNQPDLNVGEVLGSAIAKVLPYCPFSKTLDPPLPSSRMSIVPCNNQMDDKEDKEEDSSSLPSLEYRLLRQGVLQPPLFDPDYTKRQGLTSDELEYEIWLAINKFLILTKMPVSPVLLGLLPQPPEQQQQHEQQKDDNQQTNNRYWPKQFVLHPIVKELDELDPEQVGHDFVLVSPDYPAHRRQRRLSYCAAHLLETNADVANQLRPMLLKIPSTHQRLRFVLERFDQWQEAYMGEFQ